MCGDYRCLNAVKKPDKYPIPNIIDFNVHLAGSVVFTKLDIVRAFYNIRVAQSDIKKLPLQRPLDSSNFPPYHLDNVTPRKRGNVIQTRYFVELKVFIYVDDILIASADLVEHRKLVRKVLQILSDAGLTVSSSKCAYAQSEIEFLGYHVNAEGIRPLPDHVQAILDFPRPQNAMQL